MSDASLLIILIVPVVWVLWLWLIVSKPTIVFHASQVLFNFLAMCCFASNAGFQAHWKVGPSGLTGFAIFITIAGMCLSLFMLLIPVIYEKYDKFNRLARALKEIRVTFILVGTGTTVSLLIAFIVTISAWTEPGCKDATKDPHEKLGKDFQSGLGGFCSTKKAGAIFLWLAFGFWAASLGLALRDWRDNKSIRPRDPPFTAPPPPHQDEDELEYEDEESAYGHARQQQPVSTSNPYNGGYGGGTSRVPQLGNEDANAPDSPFADSNARQSGYSSAPGGAMPRPSMDAYGAFSDPAPSGFVSGPGAGVSASPVGTPGVSRTMQYADPYAAVRATIASGAGGRSGSTSPGGQPPSIAPPGYEYTGYR
ncbi:hypothetical protein BD410DRAFT_795328 [Rickenella mellea]|uniref:MARVEL domain-containing protein n=1 Tax=Rickenella mellea TaxID=50990 RepID=A0A4Y7PNC2_9AGAM|nr:hypothetical protein BD410DRAFT_795328 [Rickenella mellea]